MAVEDWQVFDLMEFTDNFICPWNFTLDACVENSLYPAPKSAGNESENVDKMPLGFMMTVPADFNGDFNGKRDG
jgi:hypothetical protein